MRGDMASPDWQQLILDPDWLQRLEHQAARRFVEPVAAEEASSFVLEKLAEDDWRRCRQFGGRSQPTTFLYSLAANLLEEFARSRYGRPRPPQWLQRQGELWVTLWKRICLERALITQVVERLSAGGHYEADLLRNIIRTIKARLPWCGAADLPIPAEFAERHIGDSEPTLEDALDEEQLHDTLAMLASLISDDDNVHLGLSADRLEYCRQSLKLDAETLLMLRLHFRDGLSFSAIARAMGVATHRPARQIKRGLKRIHNVLEHSGIDLNAAMQTLEASDS